jgi:hypothetical protein
MAVFCIVFYGEATIKARPRSAKQPYPPSCQGQRGAHCRDARKRYPLSPVSEMPSMNVRCVKKKAITMGIVMMVLTAIK